jgi:hypothetical protein
MAEHAAHRFKRGLLRRLGLQAGPPDADTTRIEIGILVHRRDQPQAAQTLADRRAQIDEHVRQVTADPARDPELARLSFEAAAPPDDDETAG